MDTLSPIKFTIQLAIKDMYRFNFDYMMKGFKKITYILLYIIILPLCIVAAIVNNEVHALTIGVIVACIILPPAFIYNIRRSYKTNKNIHEPIEYTIDEENIHLKGLTFESKISVQNLHKVAENKRAFYLWQSNNAANLIPKHLLSRENIAALSAWKEKVAKMK